MKCKHFTIRTHKNKNYCWCRYLKEQINYNYCVNCSYKEFKQYKNLKVTKSIKDSKLKKHKLTKHTEIPLKIKKIVWERDNHKCIFCNKEVPLFNANSHYIKRSHNGLGIEENIMTNCEVCHKNFDDSILRKNMMPIAKKYFQSKYEDWNEDKLVYKKWNN